MRQRTTAIILSLLAVVLGAVVYTRVPYFRLRAATSQVKGPYPTEEAWIVNEIVRDVLEMATYPAKATAPAVTASSSDGLYQVSVAQTVVELDLRDDAWAPTRFGAIARAALAAGEPGRAAKAEPSALVHPALLDFTPSTIVDAARETSHALVANMRDARAHEAAALVLGAFALREGAGRFGDTRWALNRMTAHLALAGALTDAPGLDGRLAEAVLLTLTNRQVRALSVIDRFQRDAQSAPVAAWARALRLRVTQDWRDAVAPESASRLEKEEYIRARRATVASSLAILDLQLVAASPDAGWARLVENSSLGVENGWIATEALELEQAEYRAVFQRMHGKPIGADEADALNARAARCIGPDGPQVLPWGAWSEFAQRHLAMFIDKDDRFYRKTQGSARLADQEKVRLTKVLGRLTMFSVATVFWTTGPRGAEADLTYLKEAVATALGSPERITPAEWAFLEFSTHYEPVAGGIPKPAEWFMGASPRVTQDAAARLKDAGHSQSPDITSAILKEAPYDYGVANNYLTMKYGAKTPYAEMRAVYGPRIEYDMRAVSTAEKFATTDDERQALLRTSCDLAARGCVALGWALAMTKHEPEAAAAYKRAFDDPAVDAVELSNSSGWLVTYYLRQKKVDDAMALAKRGAETQSFQGLVTYAYLVERLSRFDDAEAAYREAATHYKNPSQLLGFYYRAVIDRKDMQYEAKWTAELTPVFPQGLTPVPTGGGKPAHAVALNGDSQVTRRAGLLIGDLIVGVEGYRVESLDQYRAVNAFFERDEMKLTVWRGDKLMPFTLTAPNRALGAELRTYVIEGYKEK